MGNNNIPENLLEKAYEAYHQHDMSLAEEFLDDYLKNNAPSIETKILKSTILEEKGDFRNARDILEEILIEDNSLRIVWILLTQVCYYMLELNRVVQLCTDYLSLNGSVMNDDTMYFYEIKSRSLYGMGKYDDAIIDIDAILKYKPDHKIATLTKAKILIWCGEYNEAIELMNSILSEILDESTLGHAYYIMALAYYKLTRMIDAEKYLLKSAALNDEFGVRWLRVCEELPLPSSHVQDFRHI